MTSLLRDVLTALVQLIPILIAAFVLWVAFRSVSALERIEERLPEIRPRATDLEDDNDYPIAMEICMEWPDHVRCRLIVGSE